MLQTVLLPSQKVDYESLSLSQISVQSLSTNLDCLEPSTKRNCIPMHFFLVSLLCDQTLSTGMPRQLCKLLFDLISQDDVDNTWQRQIYYNNIQNFLCTKGFAVAWLIRGGPTETSSQEGGERVKMTQRQHPPSRKRMVRNLVIFVASQHPTGVAHTYIPLRWRDGGTRTCSAHVPSTDCTVDQWPKKVTNGTRFLEAEPYGRAIMEMCFLGISW